MLTVGARVRWRKGQHWNELVKLAMGDAVMTVVMKHPKIGFMGQTVWLLRGPNGYEDWVPESEVWVLK